MGATLSKEQETLLEEAFKKYDKDNNGVVDIFEFVEAFDLAYVREEIVEEAFGNADKNNDGKMTMKEWKAFITSRFLASFEKYDKDGSGGISVDEMRASYRRHKKSISEKELADICQELDVNKDGIITIEEYVKGLFLAFALK